MSARKAQMVLDLTGIWDAPKMSPAPKAEVPKKPRKRFKRLAKKYWKYVCAVAVVIFVWMLVHAFNRSASRHIRHIPCKHRRGTYTCSVPPEWVGDVVVEMKEECAEHVFEIGNLPFTHARWKNMFRVPGAPEVHIRDAFPGCTPRAFVDNRHVTRRKTNDLVWCAAKDHTMFSVTLDDDVVLQDATGSLMTPMTNGVWTCYTYGLIRPVTDIRVGGNGNSAIHVYNRPDIVVNE
tara:strand:- start:9776 stop:10480 length:705 start_codon:yes stop_codon:yes gene_type:complete